MSGDNKKCGRAVLLSSVALNIFLAAFVLGRVSMHLMEPPPPPPPPPFAAGAMPPPPFGGPGVGHHDHEHGHFFGPADLFTPEEMKEGADKMHENFKQVDMLRSDFAHQLQHGGVTKEQALEHFAKVDQLMESMKKDMQDKAASKISQMSDADRERFAEHLLKGPPEGGPGGPGHDGPPPPNPNGPPPVNHDGPPPEGGPGGGE